MKHFISILFISCVNLFFAQTWNKDLEKSYSKEELKTTTKEDLKVLEYGIKNAVYYTSNSAEKLLNLPEIELKNRPANFTEIGIKIKNENQYFRIKGTETILVIKSMFVLKNELSNSLK